MSTLPRVRAAASAVALCAAPCAFAQGLDLEVFATVASPTFVASPPGDTARVFVLERAGRVRIVKDGVLLPTAFLDIVPLVSTFFERGLLGLAFHPDYDANGRFFVYYNDLSGATQVVEYAVSGGDPDLADPTPVQPILSQAQPAANHNGGCLQFGPDGMLYIGLGDGGASASTAQDPTTNLGKMLRLDVDLPPPHVPPDNPFVGVAGTNDEIWAFGLRNPWRFSFDRATGDLWIADVGQSEREEVDFQPAASTGGENYGWPCLEGTRCTGSPACSCADSSLDAPIHEYTHAEGCSITGGYVYRGAAMPALRGTYFFADYCSASVWTLRWVDGEVTDLRDRTSELAGLAIPVSFGEDAAGELYVCSLGGTVYKIVPDCGTTSYCRAEPNSTGFPTELSSSGTLGVAANDFTLEAAHAVPGQFGLFFYGAAPLEIPFGNGYLCAGAGGAGLFRLNPPQLASGAGAASRLVDFTAPPAGSGAGRIDPGSTWYFQFWHRDPGVGASFNLSGGLGALFCP